MSTQPKRALGRGDLVEIRDEAEIFSTLDENGRLDGMPFMPEMAALSGRRFRVRRRAEKTCVEGHGLRGLSDTVVLDDVRCDGGAHDGCQRNCLIFWKEAWLRPVAGEPEASNDDSPARTFITPLRTREGGGYHCQSTELHAATKPMSRWDVTQFIREIREGDLTLAGFAFILWRTVANRVRFALGLKELAGRPPGPGGGARLDLGLQPGEWVEVKSRREILGALDHDARNRGLTFEPDMLPFVGRRFQVDFPVRRIILEESGRMVNIASTVALKDVTCRGLCVKNCPRANTLYWREIWLKRAG